ncbi:MAG: sensor histidine kinase [Paracoccaceae bacterium]|nr:sensor histidine kinase [Paracoccaceae bacterium]MDG1737627.1 sensor histidine kinase [Paracoccaceae bacterium]MDG2257694.1 sensor histidine kinase [Paracoccaceae bacterium]
MSAEVHSRGSIRRRLMVQLLLGAAVLAIALFFIVQSLARQLAEESQDNILAAAVSAILDTTSVRDGEIQLDLPYSAFSMLSNISNDRVFYAVRFGDDFVTGYSDLPVVTKDDSFGPWFDTTTYQDDEVRIVTAQRRLASGETPLAVEVTLAQTRDGQRDQLMWISQSAAALGTGFFVSVAVLALLAARSSISPILRLTQSVSRRGPKDLRPVAAPVPHEMVPLVAALNSFMDRLKNSLTRSEEFIADAAHRVRTPLATVRTQAEITYRRVEKDENRASIREMIRAIDESSRAAGQMLDHAMVTFRTDHLEQQAIDLNALAAEMIDRLHPMAELREIELVLEQQGAASTIGDTILLQSALRNILDNAIKYSPADSVITLIVSQDAGMAHLTTSDRGIGLPIDDAERLKSRFARGANVEGVIGSGLGLTIADEVARAHGGYLTIANNSKGPGACVTLSFPLQ